MSSDESDLEFVETTPAGDAPSGDVIRGRGPRPPVRWRVRPLWLALLLALALLAGVGIGYLTGRGGRPAAAPTPTPTLAAPSSNPAGLALASTGNVCSGVPGYDRRLLLGVEIVNTALQPVVLHAIHVQLPLSGLRVLSTQVEQCPDNPTRQVAGYRLGPAATAWISMTAVVLVQCPAPLPVRFNVDYTLDGASASQAVGGFPDLGRVRFPGCPTS